MRKHSSVTDHPVDVRDDGELAVGERKAKEVRLVLKLVLALASEDGLFILRRHPPRAIRVFSIIVACLVQNMPIFIKQAGVVGPDYFPALPARFQLVLKQLVLQLFPEEVLHVGDEVLVVQLDVAIRTDTCSDLQLLLKVGRVDVLRRRLLGLQVALHPPMVLALQTVIIYGAQALHCHAVRSLAVGNSSEDGHSGSTMDSASQPHQRNDD